MPCLVGTFGVIPEVEVGVVVEVVVVRDKARGSSERTQATSRLIQGVQPEHEERVREEVGFHCIIGYIATSAVSSAILRLPLYHLLQLLDG